MKYQMNWMKIMTKLKEKIKTIEALIKQIQESMKEEKKNG